MQDVLHVPQLRNGLLSLTRASTEQRCDTLISGNTMIFTDGNVCIETDIVDGLCFNPVDQHNAAAHTATLKRGAKLCTWHERYGHAANSTIITLAASRNVEGLESSETQSRMLTIWMCVLVARWERYTDHPFL